MSKYYTLKGTVENKTDSSNEDISPVIASEDHSPVTFVKDESFKTPDIEKSPKSSDIDKTPKVLVKDTSAKTSVEHTSESNKSQIKWSTSSFEYIPEKEGKTFETFGEDTTDKDEISSKNLGDNTLGKNEKSSEFCEDIHEKEDKSSESFDEFNAGKEEISFVSCGEDLKDKSEKILSPSKTATIKSSATSEGKKLEFREKRRPRLNRRSFHLQNVLDEPKSRKVTEKDASKRNICLSADKKTAPVIVPMNKEKKKIFLKRKELSSFEEETTEPSKTSDAPPKKKHKPITWP